MVAPAPVAPSCVCWEGEAGGGLPPSLALFLSTQVAPLHSRLVTDASFRLCRLYPSLYFLDLAVCCVCV